MPCLSKNYSNTLTWGYLTICLHPFIFWLKRVKMEQNYTSQEWYCYLCSFLFCKSKYTFFSNISELTLSSAEAVLLVWLGKATMHDVKLDKDLKPLARQFNLKLLRNKDKNMHVRAIASTLIERGLVLVTTNLNNVSREAVTVKVWNLFTDEFSKC